MSEERDEAAAPGAPSGEEPAPDSGTELDEASEAKLRDMLRGALKAEPAPESDVLRGVQKRRRARSQGKFYDDEWSTARRPTYTYLWTSVLMLVIVVFVYGMMVSFDGVVHEVDNTPAPVRILFPRSAPPGK
jgi:hypothetical protein